MAKHIIFQQKHVAAVCCNCNLQGATLMLVTALTSFDAVFARDADTSTVLGWKFCLSIHQTRVYFEG